MNQTVLRGSKWLYVEEALLLIAIGVALRISIASANGSSPTCPVGDSCVKVLTSPLSSVFGVPISYFGVGVSALLLALLTYEWDRGKAPGWPHLLLTCGSACVAIGLQAYAFLIVRSMCVLCITYCGSLIAASALVVARRAATPSPGGVTQLVFLILGGGLVCANLFYSPVARPNNIANLFVHDRSQLASLLYGPHVQFGNLSSKRYLYVFANPECAHCANELPVLIKRAQSALTPPHIICCWITQSDNGKLKVAVLASLAQRNLGQSEMEPLMNKSLSKTDSILGFAKRLKLSESTLSTAWSTGSELYRTIEHDDDVAEKLGITSTPAFIACSENGRCVELSFKQALSYL